jgi:hypothetical protein
LATTTGIGVQVLGDTELHQIFDHVGLKLDKKVECLADQMIVEAVKK